jgi:hypothetical protein
MSPTDGAAATELAASLFIGAFMSNVAAPSTSTKATAIANCGRDRKR